MKNYKKLHNLTQVTDMHTILLRKNIQTSYRLFPILLLLLLSFNGYGQEKQSFTNPLLPSGADPFSFFHDGHYYYTHTLQNRLVLWKTKSLADLASAEKKVIWEAPENTMYSQQ